MITPERKKELSRDKLTGLEEIACYLHWSLSKTKRRVKQWQEAGVLFTDLIGTPPRPVYCTYISLLHRWIVMVADRGEHL
ncbi:MAG TPA: hypothetical protein PKH14_12830 [Syntrophorhabdus sp.]|mgnify:CR=1 FL=1|nr:hypothetical protein [Syntrophorhabdus sp.]